MNLIDKVILEWSYKTKKGYPDINNEDDMRIFESLFGFNLKETPLTPKELGKQNSKTKEERVDILINKIIINKYNVKLFYKKNIWIL